MAQPAQDKLEKLRQALQDYESGAAGGGFVDREAEEAKAQVRQRALRLLDQRARSRHELRDRLLRLEFDAEVVDMVLDDLARVDLLDDELFAREWVRQRHARRGKSARALDRELQAKGVGQSARAAALEQVSAESEEATARAVAEKKARSIAVVPADRRERDKFLRRIVGAIARRGFPESMAVRIGIEVLDARIAAIESGVH